MELIVTYSSVDGYRSRRTFKTHPAAKRFAVRYVGQTPEFGPGYAVADDGIGKVTVSGCTLAQLFGDGPPPPAASAAPVAPSQAASGPIAGDYGWRKSTIIYSWINDAAVGVEYEPVRRCPDVATAQAEVEAEWKRLYDGGSEDERIGIEVVQFNGRYWNRVAVLNDCPDEIPF
jgi:hypothetical protein